MVGMICKPYGMTVANVGRWSSTIYPASNLTLNSYSQIGQSDSVPAGTNAYITFDFGVPAPVDTIALLWHNLLAAAGDTFWVQAASVADFSSGVVYAMAGFNPQTGSTYRDIVLPSKFLLTLPNPVTARYWRIVFNNGGSAAKVYTAARAFFGQRLQLAYGASKATLGAVDLNANVTTEVGEQRSQEDQSLIRPVVSLSYSYAKQSEKDQVFGGYTLSLGSSKPLLVCADLSDPFIQDNTAFGRLEQVVNLQSDSYDIWQFGCVVTSIGP